MSSQRPARTQSIQIRNHHRWSWLLLICFVALFGFVAQVAAAEEATQQDAAISSSQPFAEASVTHVAQGAATGARHLPPASNTISYWFGPAYHTVFVRVPNTSQGATIQRNTVEFTHASFWKLGSNFADIYLNKSNLAEPTKNNTGATELYGIFRAKIGLNEVTGTHAFQFGPVRDVAVEVGTNLAIKNSVYGPAERSILVGPNVQLNVPRGFLNVGFHMRKEWNKQEILGKAEHYTPNFNIEPTWMLPFSTGKFQLAYSGVAEYNTQKGTDSFGNPTVADFMVRNWVTVDAGELLLHQPGRLTVNAGFWYWHNEFGKPSSNPGGQEMAPIFGLTFHLGGGSRTGK